MPEKGAALFDFCETVANYQTADPFVLYTQEHFGSRCSRSRLKAGSILRKRRVEIFLSRIFRGIQIRKASLLRSLKGMPEATVKASAKAYYDAVVKPNLIPETVAELKKLQHDGWNIFIVSSGYDVYLRCFAEDFGIPETNVVATKIRFRNGRCTGKFDGNDCRETEKVKAVIDAGLSGIHPTIAFSDSRSDIPIMTWADEAVVVKEEKANDQFADYPGFKRIEWHR